MKKIGIYGGTFSPPHVGHVASAISFRDGIGLDRLIVMPSNVPPHKEVSENNPAARLDMTRLAFGGVEKAEVSDYEISNPGRSYTADTLTHFYSDDSELFFLCGTDMFLTLHTWRRPEVILRLATIVLARRESDGYSEEIARANEMLKSRFGARTVILNHKPIEISSTQVRKMISQGEDTSEYLCPEVAEYIKANGLYQRK